MAEKMNKKHFWNWTQNRATDEKTGEIAVERALHLYGTIAPESWFEDDVTPSMFKEELEAEDGPVTVYINSPGGDCVAASQIYTMLMEYGHPVTVKIDGIAASAASVIAMAGSAVLMSPTALMMCHNPATMAFGDHGEMEKAIDMLDSVKESILNAYEIKTGLDRDTLSKMMDEETWMDATKAIELGFADGMIPSSVSDAHSMADKASPVLFSQKSVDKALVNRLKASSGIPVGPLYQRLERLKP